MTVRLEGTGAGAQCTGIHKVGEHPHIKNNMHPQVEASQFMTVMLVQGLCPLTNF